MWVCTKICDVDLDKTHRKCHPIIDSILTYTLVTCLNHSFFKTHALSTE